MKRVIEEVVAFWKKRTFPTAYNHQAPLGRTENILIIIIHFFSEGTLFGQLLFI